MSSPTHIKLPSVGTSGASAAAVALTTAGTPATTGAPAADEARRASTRRSSRPTRRTRKHVMMPTSARGAKREGAKREDRAAARAATVATLPTAAPAQVASVEAAAQKPPVRPDEKKRTCRDARTARTVHAQSQGNILQRVALGFTASPIRMRLLLVAVVAVVAIVSIYPSVRDYYVASRDREVLSARYAELSATNDELMHDISYLQSTEGIEDEARRRGYVLPGETSVSVEGIDGLDVVEEAVPADAPWYQAALDAIFGYEPQEW